MPSRPRGKPGTRDIMFSLSVQTTTIAPVGNTGRPIDCKFIVGVKQGRGKPANLQYSTFLFLICLLVSLSALGIAGKRDL